MHNLSAFTEKTNQISWRTALRWEIRSTVYLAKYGEKKEEAGWDNDGVGLINVLDEFGRHSS